MIINKIESYTFLYKIKNHLSIKEKILDYIKSEPNKNHSNNSSELFKFDFENFKVKPYEKILFNDISEYIEELKKLFNCHEIMIHNCWYQQYIKNNFHSWHTHGGCNLSSVYYVELPSNKYQTEFFDTIKKSYINVGKVEEGDILTFPSYIAHRSKKIEDDTRKTIISFNLSVQKTKEEFINKNVF